MTWLVYALFAAQIADALSTVWFLRYGGKELNPMMASLIENAGPYGFVVVKIMVGAFLGYGAYLGYLPNELIIGMLVFYAGLVVNNVLLVFKLKRH